jgi:hypothetical protein
VKYVSGGVCYQGERILYSVGVCVASALCARDKTDGNRVKRRHISGISVAICIGVFKLD